MSRGYILVPLSSCVSWVDVQSSFLFSFGIRRYVLVITIVLMIVLVGEGVGIRFNRSQLVPPSLPSVAKEKSVLHCNREGQVKICLTGRFKVTIVGEDLNKVLNFGVYVRFQKGRRVIRSGGMVRFTTVLGV